MEYSPAKSDSVDISINIYLSITKQVFEAYIRLQLLTPYGLHCVILLVNSFREWRRLHNEKLLSLSRRLRWAGHIARMGEGRSALKFLTGNPRAVVNNLLSKKLQFTEFQSFSRATIFFSCRQ